MISRRDKLLNYPWEQQRYEQHRAKVRSAKPAIDTHTPRQHQHIQRKWKKLQKERERTEEIENENLRLIQKLSEIMRTKRMNDLWLEPRPNFLQREKLFPTRPYSSLPKIITIYGGTNANEIKKTAITQKKTSVSKPTSAVRCPTCSGQPTRTEVHIPEPRLPWAPPRKSWNAKLDKEPLPKRCFHCGRYRLTPKPSDAIDPKFFINFKETNFKDFKNN